jgi:hypothetical protein
LYKYIYSLEKNEKPEEKGFIEKWGLNDWKFAVPIGMMVGIPAIYNEVTLSFGITYRFHLDGSFFIL